jgi:preprotein translocase subunit SecF
MNDVSTNKQFAREPVTYGLAARLWWALMWRSVLFSFAAGVVIGIIMGVLGAILGIKLIGLNMVLGLVAGVVASIWVAQRLLNKGFGPYRLIIMKRVDNAG